MLKSMTGFGVLAIGAVLVFLGVTSEKVLEIQQSINNSTELWQVSRVADGDTITVVRNGEERRIRFCGVDAPETAHKSGEISQSIGEAAKEFVEDAIARNGGKVGIEFVEKDRYGRWIGEIWLNVGGEPPEILLNEQLVLNGLAWPYKQYWGNCPNRSAIEAAEKMATQSGAGIWLDSANQPPWEWRRQN